MGCGGICSVYSVMLPRWLVRVPTEEEVHPHAESIQTMYSNSNPSPKANYHFT